jgi:TetR/AcrR family transcriptional repressor of nem operon
MMHNVRMARPIEYDMDDVLEGAMSAFWAKGFAATGIRELVQATGLSTRSLYNLFESKEGLYEAALQKYRSDYCEGIYATLQNARGRRAIVAMFDELAAAKMEGGCFMVRTLNEQTLLEPRCIQAAKAHFKKLERLLVQKLDEMSEDGEFGGDPAGTARALLLVMQGASSYQQDPRSARHLRGVIDDILEALGVI